MRLAATIAIRRRQHPVIQTDDGIVTFDQTTPRRVIS
jgi:hypothetical protein